jgi:hypothetical protein
MPLPPSIYFVLRYHDRYYFVNYIDSNRVRDEPPAVKVAAEGLSLPLLQPNKVRHPELG